MDKKNNEELIKKTNKEPKGIFEMRSNLNAPFKSVGLNTFMQWAYKLLM